jgi:serine/threonine protein kinase
MFMLPSVGAIGPEGVRAACQVPVEDRRPRLSALACPGLALEPAQEHISLTGMKSIAPGDILDGKYEIVGLLGAGGMGEVYKARHIHLNAYRCIKVMKPALLADDMYRTRFLREARLATQIHHPNIAVVHDFELAEDGASYMVAEFIDGTTVRQWSLEHGRFPLPLVAEIAVQVLAGLDAIHRRGLLHRDISPDNVMMSFDADDRLVVKIIDLGVAKDITATTDTTQAGMLVGNPKYMAPEQLGELEEGEQLDARADLYCLGVVLYEMLTGVPPFMAKTPNGYIVKKLTEPAPPFKQVQPDLTWPDGLEEIVMRTLERDRRRRFNSARDLSHAIEPFLTRATGTYTRTEVDRLQRVENRMIAPHAATQVVSDAHLLSAAEAFHIAWEDGTTGAWRRFLETHGDAPEAERARMLLAEANDFERAISAESETGLREFLKVWPEGRHRYDAEIRLVEVKRRLEEEAERAAKRAAEEKETQDALDAIGREEGDAAVALLAKVSAPELRAKVEEALETLRKKKVAEREPRDFDAAWERGSVAAWDEYIALHGAESRNGQAVRCRQEAAEFEVALAANTTRLWRAFLKAWPDGRHRLDAELRIR